MTDTQKKKLLYPDRSFHSLPAVNPAGITQSYYTKPSTADNYETGRPIYRQSQAVKDAASAVVQVEQQKPDAYQSRYDQRIQQMIDGILDREAFTYDPAADPLYRQYADQYQRKGQLAMRDAMAQSAALTGGYGSSYAAQAGQQGYQRYLEEMNNIIPQLQEAAYRMYQDEGDTQRTNLGMLQSADATDYTRHRDTVSDWQDELKYYSGKLADMSDREYQTFVHDAKAWENDRDYWANKAQDDRDYQLALAKLNASGSGRSGRSGGSGSNTGSAASLLPHIVQGISQTRDDLLEYLRNRTGGTTTALRLKA